MDPGYEYEPPDIDPQEGCIWERLHQLLPLNTPKSRPKCTCLWDFKKHLEWLNTELQRNSHSELTIVCHQDYDMTDEYWVWGQRTETAEDRIAVAKKEEADAKEAKERAELRRLKKKYEAR